MARIAYDRKRDLPRLMPVWPDDLADKSLAGRTRILAQLEHYARGLRAAALVNAWHYDLARHRQVLAALEHERRELLAMEDTDADTDTHESPAGNDLAMRLEAPNLEG